MWYSIEYIYILVNLKMKCKKCGFENVNEALYCINCGQRLDNKKVCYKCHKVISEDDKKCPHCGATISSSSKITKEESQTHSKINHIFNRIFCIFSIVLFAFFSVGVWGKYVTFDTNLTLNKWTGSTPFYLWMQWSQIIDQVKASSNVGETISILLPAISRCVLVATTICVVTVFSIKGLIKSIKGVKTGTYDSLMCLMVCTLTYSLCSVLLLCSSMYLSESDRYVFTKLSDHSINILVNALIIISAVLIVSTIMKFRKNRIPLFLVNLFISLSLLFVFAILLTSSEPIVTYKYSGYSVSYRSLNLLNTCINNIAHLSSNTDIAIFVLSCNYVIFQFLFYILIIINIIFVTYHLTNDKVQKHRFYIPNLALSIANIVVSMSLASISVAMYFLFKSYGSTSISLTSFILTFLNLGFAISSFVIVRKFNRFEKSTTKE